MPVPCEGLKGHNVRSGRPHSPSVFDSDSAPPGRGLGSALPAHTALATAGAYRAQPTAWSPAAVQPARTYTQAAAL